MQRNWKYLAAGLILAFCVTALPTLAAEGREPIWMPTVIGADGSYFVSRDIVAPPASGPAISIAAVVEHLVLDLNGFTVFGDPAGGPPVIEITGAVRSVTIRNGEVRHLGPGGNGIYVKGAQKVTIEDVRTLDTENGIYLEDVGSFALRRNMTTDSGLNGIYVTGFGVAAPIHGTIEDNVIKTSASVGIYVDGNHSAVKVRNNSIESAGDFGIFMSGGEGFIVAENTVEDTGTNGIRCEAGNNSKLYNNVVHRSGGDGIHLVGLGGFLVLDNVTGGNMGDGIFIDGFLCHVDRNVMSFNSGFGLHFGPGSANNTYGRNTSRGNGGGGAACAFIAPVEPCGAIGGGGGSFPPDFCNESGAGIGNTSFCDNLMPGPPRS